MTWDIAQKKLENDILNVSSEVSDLELRLEEALNEIRDLRAKLSSLEGTVSDLDLRVEHLGENS
ncbi:hypothetical protein EV662_102176 [Rhodovulum marinum]|uniref:Uncharacterized protein n=1 Tax=Rhodovulum marinum TaxID=320662 RepID=A0A4R2Q502_9RHOB|nr:hypothetical protein EV662_102176 [Rhodovulum marinum]